jgi:hypothetical protein
MFEDTRRSTHHSEGNEKQHPCYNEFKNNCFFNALGWIWVDEKLQCKENNYSKEN